MTDDYYFTPSGNDQGKAHREVGRTAPKWDSCAEYPQKLYVVGLHGAGLPMPSVYWVALVDKRLTLTVSSHHQWLNDGAQIIILHRKRLIATHFDPFVGKALQSSNLFDRRYVGFYASERNPQPYPPNY